MTRPAGLGRGLGALIPSAGPGQSGLLSLPLSAIRPNPRQPRGDFDDEALNELAESLREVGMIQPIVVRPLDDASYEIVAGERRYRAARRAGLDAVPAVVRHTADTDLLVEALVENVHRADLNPLEEAAAYQQLRDDFDVTHEQLARRLGKSRSSVSNSLRLLTLPPALQQQVATGVLSAGHARALLAVSDPAQQQRLATRVLAEALSVRATEDLARSATAAGGASGDGASGGGASGGASRAAVAAGERGPTSGPYDHLERRLSDALSTRVTISGTAARGRVVVDYAGPDDLQRLLDVLSRGVGEDLTAE